MSTTPTEHDLDRLRDLSRGPELQQWLAAENSRYEQARTAWAPIHERLHEQARALLPASVSTPVWTVAGRRFRWHWSDGADYPVLLMGRGDGERVVLDLAALTDTGFIRCGDVAVSPDATRLAFTVDTLGAEAYELRVLDLDDVDAPPVTLADRAYYGMVWASGSRRLLSVKHDAADRPFQVWAYDVADQSATLILEEQDERFHVGLRGSGAASIAVIRAASRLTAEERLVDLGSLEVSPTRGREDGVDYTIEPLELDGVPLLAHSREVGDEYVVALEDREGTVVRRLLDPAPTRRPRSLVAMDGHLVVHGREGGAPTIWVIDLRDSTLEPVVVQAGPGTSISLAPYDAPSGSACVELDCWTAPTGWQNLDLATGALTPAPSAAGDAPDTSDLLVEERHVPARDGQAIAVTILRSRTTPLDGTAPCLLYGYGAWETVIEPEFEASRLALVRAGVVYAHAHIRGGGEQGRDWWRQGRMSSKVTTFHDFIDVADALANGVVDPNRIVAQGLSAGGLLMGAVNALAPSRFTGILAEAPFVDPITTMSDPTQPLVVVERDEWGDPRRERDLGWMRSWAPLDNVPSPQEQPRLLVTSALHDPRVSVWEPARWVARITGQGAADRVLLRVDLGARGHWPPPGRWQRIAFTSEILAWAADTMGLDDTLAPAPRL